MSTIKHFKHCKTLDEVKAEYKKLAQQWLQNEDDETSMAILEEIDQEFISISQRPKFMKLSQEIQSEFINFPEIVKSLIKLKLNMECIGSWIWVSGPTIDCKEKLKDMGLKYSPSKTMWYYRPVWSKASNSTPMSLDYIRRKYGSDSVQPEFAFDQEPYKKQPIESNQGRLPV